MYTGNYSVYRCSLGILGGNGLIYFMMSYFHWGFEFVDWSKLSYGWLHGMPFTYIWIKFHYYVSNCEHSKIKIPEIYPHLQYYSISKKEEIISGGSKNFKIGGEGGVYIQAHWKSWGLEIVLIPLQWYALCLVVRVENKIHIVIIAHWQ